MTNLLLRIFFPDLFVKKECIPNLIAEEVEAQVSARLATKSALDHELADAQTKLKIAQAQYNRDYTLRLNKALNAAPQSAFSFEKESDIDEVFKADDTVPKKQW